MLQHYLHQSNLHLQLRLVQLEYMLVVAAGMELVADQAQLLQVVEVEVDLLINMDLFLHNHTLIQDLTVFLEQHILEVVEVGLGIVLVQMDLLPV